jgi:glucosamine--fructose-6-phosphate aminotransferase (isomerizing)
MCGIVGAVAQRNIVDFLLNGLNRLEYRGYDSAGIAVLEQKSHALQRLRTKGKVANLVSEIQKKPIKGQLGIAHTRWATHGEPSIINAHPHCSKEQIAVVHNGIIENHEVLKIRLMKAGYEFESNTDTEIIAHLIHECLQKEKDLLLAVQCAVHQLKGSYALGIIDNTHPHELYAVRSGSPLIIGLSQEEENFIASDITPMAEYTNSFIYLEENDIACVKKNSVKIFDTHLKAVNRKIYQAAPSCVNISKGQFRHYMQKEIFEQPESLLNTLEGQITGCDITLHCFGKETTDVFPKVKRILMIACGTSYHAALVGKQWIESLAQLPCAVEISSENRYRDQVIEPDTLLIALSQSGETADTLAALKQAKKTGKFLSTLSICNVHNSSLVRETDLCFITRAGVEIGVAATKTFTCQLTALLLVSLSLSQARHIQHPDRALLIQHLLHLPALTRELLELNHSIKKLSNHLQHKRHMLFLGRQTLYPIAMEGALKLKEISYLNAQSYPAGELKHGPLALIEKDTPVIVLMPSNLLFQKLHSNVKEVQARYGDLIILTDSNQLPLDTRLKVIPMPYTHAMLTPIIYTIPLQMLAYHVAVLKGTDVDQPRNLAKSVTVE